MVHSCWSCPTVWLTFWTLPPCHSKPSLSLSSLGSNPGCPLKRRRLTSSWTSSSFVSWPLLSSPLSNSLSETALSSLKPSPPIVGRALTTSKLTAFNIKLLFVVLLLFLPSSYSLQPTFHHLVHQRTLVPPC